MRIGMVSGQSLNTGTHSVDALSIERGCKLFGGDTALALTMLRSGQERDVIERESGASVAVADVSFTVPAGRNFVLGRVDI